MTEHKTEKAHLTVEQVTGVKRLTALAPAIANYYDPSDSEPRDVCAACGDCECGGACPGALEIVRQVIEALGSGDDDWFWWVNHFEDCDVIPPGASS